MNFQHVRAFCAIVDEKSFSRAADSLHLTQPTISSQIQALEKYLGTRVFERSAQGIALTQAGRTFRPYAFQMLELAERAREAVEQVQGLARGQLEVGASSVPGHYILPPLLVDFKQRAPGVTVALTVANSHDIRTGVHDGLFELGVVGEKVRDERLTFEAVLEDELVAVMRPSHPLAERPALCPAELMEWPLILREQGSGTRATFERALGRAGLPLERLKVWLELGSTEAVKAAVRTTDAISVLSRWAIDDEVQSGLLKAAPLAELDVSRSFFLVWRTHGYLSIASERFSELVRGRAAQA
jgi:DNA-binding transcriptional LysR family regulator